MQIKHIKILLSGLRGILVFLLTITALYVFGCKKEGPQKEIAFPRISLEEKLQSKIAFTSNRDGNPEIYVMNVDGSEQKRLTTNNTFDVLPNWSPDGKKIAFILKRKVNWQIYIMNTDGSKRKRLTNKPACDGDISWSPFMTSEGDEKE